MGSDGASGPESVRSAPPQLVAGTDTHTDTASLQVVLGDWKTWRLEGLVVFAAILIVDFAWFGGAHFRNLSPNPFWIPVLLLSAQHGIIAGVVATVAATAITGTGAPAETAANGQPAMDFYAQAAAFALQPLQWLVAALVLGGLRTHARMREIATEQKVLSLTVERETLADGLERALSEITRLEQRIASDVRTPGSVARALSHLDATSPKGLAASYSAVAQAVAGPLRLYIKGRDGFEAADRFSRPLKPELTAWLENPSADRGAPPAASLPQDVLAIAPIRRGHAGEVYGALVMFGQEASADVQQLTEQLAAGLTSILGFQPDTRHASFGAQPAE
jgi:ADP-ribose pyrophosphatase YjhB (NUDIX family)